MVLMSYSFVNFCDILSYFPLRQKCHFCDIIVLNKLTLINAVKAHECSVRFVCVWGYLM